MKISLPFLFFVLLAALPLTVAAAEPEVIYWNSDAGKLLRAAEKARQLAEQTGTPFVVRQAINLPAKTDTPKL